MSQFKEINFFQTFDCDPVSFDSTLKVLKNDGLVIKEFDDINEGSLKDITNLELDDLKSTFQQLKQIVPEKLIINILNKVQRAQEDTEMLLLLEELN